MHTKKKAFAILGLGVIFAMVAAACSNNGGGTTSSPAGPAVKAGGAYRTAIEDFGFTGGFDPTGEYLGTAFGLFSQLLIRNLVGYDHVAGGAGDKIVPDLATDTGQVSSDGLTYTFKLKSGVKFGPPLNRAITSKDIEYAFERIDTKSMVAQYGFYYDGTVVGMDGPHDGDPTPISGISTPDDQTIVFTLKQPTGDFLYRLAMPAAAAMPKEVAGCFTKAGDYGRDLVSSGPYMIKGADQVDASSCSTIKPMSGFDPTKQMLLVRNPAYDPATDSTSARSNYLNGVSIVIDTNTDDIFQQIEAGTLDGSLASQPPAPVEAKYLADPQLKGLLKSEAADRTWYLTMNLLVPPFDDIHVRKAVNFVVDKAAMQKIRGGAIHGDIATHVFPPTVLPEFPSGYDPYPSPGSHGDVTAAMNEMKQSKYDHNGDGKCDDPVCNNVLFINRTTPPQVNNTPVLTQNLASIGINLKVRELDTGTAYQTIQTVKNLIPFAGNAGWGKDYADPYTFAVLFQSSGINCDGQINYSELGMTQAQATECGNNVLTAWQAAQPPSVDDEINTCIAALGDARNQCWVQFDKDLMENVVPWVPYNWGKALTIIGSDVTRYEFDQFSGIISLCHVAVSNTATV